MQGHFKERVCECALRIEKQLWKSEDGKESWTLIGCEPCIEKSFSWSWYKKTSKGFIK